ncbi:FeoB-associated Cys-rich membrane protein [Tepidibacter thalassicus]|uniref:Virus attachment protein p12 family protein n=1 Tax=Tepidibacter thalassicus DSM 15285 TaxID=1123350 RepID=A0A1M5QMC6_9FIRM|nr:FeoB-associated Cys-rich membrane protein [Tepidibacter thalassicus]SHH14949.1 hypothetical protein SAMN02744040_01027 [Tepidibacter thalassicus DSM 15285]
MIATISITGIIIGYGLYAFKKSIKNKTQGVCSGCSGCSFTNCGSRQNC